MNGRTTTLGGVIGAAVLTVIGLSTTSCDETTLDNLAQQCGFACPDPGKGVLSGNASVTGYGAIDGYFQSAINYNNVATSVSAEIDGELLGIQSLFGISDAELKGKTLGAAITAKLDTQFQASVVVNAQPAKCAVDARIAGSVAAKCQAAADCKVDPGKVDFQCMGTCTVDVNAQGRCDGMGELKCNVTGPEVDCTGECSGTCTVQAPSVSCNGNCVGTCSAECKNDTDPGENCNGQCTGMCTGSCQLTGTAAASCTGKCNGSCRAKAPSGGCQANAEASCDFEASASAVCTGKCSGEFLPPKADCSASASCEATARAEARFQVVCTPPSVEVKIVSRIGASAQAQVDFMIGQLKLRLPRLAAAQAHAKLAREAADELAAAGRNAVQATADGMMSGDIDLITSARITNCMGDQLGESQMLISQASARLKEKTDSAASVAVAIGMTM